MNQNQTAQQKLSRLNWHLSYHPQEARLCTRTELKLADYPKTQSHNLQKSSPHAFHWSVQTMNQVFTMQYADALRKQVHLKEKDN